MELILFFSSIIKCEFQSIDVDHKSEVPPRITCTLPEMTHFTSFNTTLIIYIIYPRDRWLGKKVY